MAFPAQVFYSILEVSVRWGCSVTQVVNNAIADKLDLVKSLMCASTTCAIPLPRCWSRAAPRWK